MRRLFFLMPNLESCRQVVAELEDEGVPEHHLHAIASLDQSLDGLPEAGVLQKTELAHGLEWGAGLGGVAGMLGGLLAVSFPPAGLVLGGGALLVGAAAGAGFGAVVSALLSSHEHNHDLDAFQRAIEAGEILLMVDIPRQRVDKIRELILNHHPEAHIGVAKLPA
ncbi:hypothetical protein [Candidatus Endoriftia persephone]|uniref:Transmembrane protein n=3 Tax=Gammaproteobacteria TaxID=1236 RepID=G2FJV0_9GAMM|nr:hypothetical protein [Candidatus Endoriftia persephone]EGV50585.1 hypothetical protein Rifp1Sym_cu00110 [endosymbiont of Riftia pachyptila (vent Ph05)]EGW52922.1 hypothetical protein TevJSym_ca00020 [endosymbiont of Tevnia jerichonana (vent Tica)]USF86168.1 DUF1269 domain-containing protein [Candidatus Endoriftia persephone]